MEQVRYYGIEKPVIPTAKGLGREVQQTDIKILNTTKNFYIQPIILARQAEKITKNKFKFNENKKSKRRLSANEVYRKYSSRFIGISQDGKVIDKVSNTELGYATDITSEEIGTYIKSTYESTNYERPTTGTEVEDVFELENFIAEIQARISAAAKDMAWGQHGSQQGIDAIQNALNKFSKSDWEKAFAQYNNYVEEIRQALDQALYYSKSEEEHLRAINVAVDLLSLNKTDINFSYDDYSEVDYSDYADYQYGRPYKYTKYYTTKIEPPIEQQTVEEPKSKTYKAYVKDSSGTTEITSSGYSNKESFIRDLKANGYSVIYSALESNYDVDKFFADKEADAKNQPRSGETYEDMLNRQRKNSDRRIKKLLK